MCLEQNAKQRPFSLLRSDWLAPVRAKPVESYLTTTGSQNKPSDLWMLWMKHAWRTSQNTLVFTGKPPHYQKNQQAEYSCTNTGRRDAGGTGQKMGWENGKSNHAKLIDPQSPTFTTFCPGCGHTS